MKRKNRPRSSSLFLMELILAILFFSIASAVCVQFFVKSHLLSQNSNALSHAVNECAGAAEIMETSDSIADSVDMLKRLYPDGTYPDIDLDSLEITEADTVIYYDENFTACNETDGAYLLTLHIEKTDQMLAADMQFTKKKIQPSYMN